MRRHLRRHVALHLDLKLGVVCVRREKIARNWKRVRHEFLYPSLVRARPGVWGQRLADALTSSYAYMATPHGCQVAGVVTSVNRRPEKVLYLVDDGTGAVNCLVWRKRNPHPK